MAVRRPLYYASGNLREMSESQISDVISQVSYLYSLNPSVTLSRVASGGTLGSISDTRKQAGAYRTSTTAFPSEATTPEPGTVTVNYDRISETVESLTEPTDTDNKLYPLYYDGTNLRAMSTTDMYDTFILPAIDNLTSGSTGTAQGGTYRIHTASSLAGHTAVSTSVVFRDTRADTSLYTAGGIPETLDQPQTITNFYLLQINGSATSYVPPVSIVGNNPQTYTESNFNTALQNLVRYAAAQKTGTRIRYNLNGTGNNRGSGMTNTILDGNGNYQTRFVNANDYRAQEFPNGTAQIANTYYLRVTQS